MTTEAPRIVSMTISHHSVFEWIMSGSAGISTVSSSNDSALIAEFRYSPMHPYPNRIYEIRVGSPFTLLLFPQSTLHPIFPFILPSTLLYTPSHYTFPLSLLSTISNTPPSPIYFILSSTILFILLLLYPILIPLHSILHFFYSPSLSSLPYSTLSYPHSPSLILYYILSLYLHLLFPLSLSYSSTLIPLYSTIFYSQLYSYYPLYHSTLSYSISLNIIIYPSFSLYPSSIYFILLYSHLFFFFFYSPSAYCHPNTNTLFLLSIGLLSPLPQYSFSNLHRLTVTL